MSHVDEAFRALAHVRAEDEKVTTLKSRLKCLDTGLCPINTTVFHAPGQSFTVQFNANNAKELLPIIRTELEMQIKRAENERAEAMARYRKHAAQINDLDYEG